MNMKSVKISAEVMGKSRQAEYTIKMTDYDVTFGPLCIFCLHSLDPRSLNNRRILPDIHPPEKSFQRNRNAHLDYVLRLCSKQ